MPEFGAMEISAADADATGTAGFDRDPTKRAAPDCIAVRCNVG